MVVRLPDEADAHRAALDVRLGRDGAQVVDVRPLLDRGRGRRRGLVASARSAIAAPAATATSDDDSRADRERLPADSLEEETEPPHQPATSWRKVVTAVNVRLGRLDEAHVADSGQDDEAAAGDPLVEGLRGARRRRAVVLAHDHERRLRDAVQVGHVVEVAVADVREVPEHVRRSERLVAVTRAGRSPAKWNGICTRSSSLSSSSVATVFSCSQLALIGSPASPIASSDAATSASSAALESPPPEIRRRPRSRSRSRASS